MNLASYAVALVLAVPTATTASNSHDFEFNSMHQKTYGVDVSFPHHHTHVSTNYDWLPHNDPAKSSPSHPNYAPPPNEYASMPVQRLGNRQDFYDEFMEGCRHHEKTEHAAGDQTEADRISMNLRQPQSMLNYTDLGFAKIKTPEKVFKQIVKFWEENKGQEEVEEWFTGNTYTNHVSFVVLFDFHLFLCVLSYYFGNDVWCGFFWSCIRCSYCICMNLRYCSVITDQFACVYTDNVSM